MARRACVLLEISMRVIPLVCLAAVTVGVLLVPFAAIAIVSDEELMSPRPRIRPEYLPRKLGPLGKPGIRLGLAEMVDLVRKDQHLATTRVPAPEFDRTSFQVRIDPVRQR